MSRREPQEKSSSSASAPSPSPILESSFGDFLEKLRTRGLNEKADSYLIAVSEECQKRQDTRGPLTLPLETAIQMIENPRRPPRVSRLDDILSQLTTLLPMGKFSSFGNWDNEYMGSYLREQERIG